MPLPKPRHDLTPDAPSAVLRVEGIESRLIGKSQGLAIGINLRLSKEQIVSFRDDPGNGYSKTLLCFMQHFSVSNRDTFYLANNNIRHFASSLLALAAGASPSPSSNPTFGRPPGC